MPAAAAPAVISAKQPAETATFDPEWRDTEAFVTGPFSSEVRDRPNGIQLAVTLLIVGLPLIALVVVCTQLLGSSVTAVNLSLTAAFYVITGMGIRLTSTATVSGERFAGLSTPTSAGSFGLTRPLRSSTRRISSLTR